MFKYNSTIKFPDKKTLEDLIDYVNSDMTNKFTLIINNTSRPNTSALKTRPSSRIHSGLRQLPPIERRVSRSHSQLNSIAYDDNNDLVISNLNDDEINFNKVPSVLK